MCLAVIFAKFGLSFSKTNLHEAGLINIIKMSKNYGEKHLSQIHNTER
jgi:hypothetical protein